MSLVFSKTDIISIDDHDGECMNPTEFVCPALPHYLCPQVNNHDNSDLSSFDKKSTIQASYASASTSETNGWLSRLNKREKWQKRLLGKLIVLIYLS